MDEEESPDEEPEQNEPAFQGFRKPKKKHYFCLPNEWTDITAEIDNLPELKIVEYVIRHTWGFQNYDNFQDISVDEFMHGRKHRDGSRMDVGTKLSETGAKRGIARAIEHGYIVCEIDNTDKGRVIKSYKPKMLPMDEVGGLTETPQGLAETLGGLTETARGSQENPRTDKEIDKDTLKRHREKKDDHPPVITTAIEQMHKYWCASKYFRGSKKIAANNIKDYQTLAEKIEHISSQERFDSLCVFALTQLPPNNDGKLWISNLANSVDVWLKSQEEEVKILYPAQGSHKEKASSSQSLTMEGWFNKV